MANAYDLPGGGSTTRASLGARKSVPKRKARPVAVRKKPSPVTYVPGLGAVTRPTPRMKHAARAKRSPVSAVPGLGAVTRPKAKPRPASKPAPRRNPVSAVPGLGAATRPKPKQSAAERERGPFTKHPVKGMLDAEHRAIEALGALHASDPKKYETALAKAGLRERATAGPRGQTIEHFKGRTIGEHLTDRPVKKLPPKRMIKVAGYRGQTMPKPVKASLGGDLLKTAIQNAPKNAGDILTGMPTSLVYGVAHPVRATKETVKEYKDLVVDPEKAISERPISTALMVSGAARAPGLLAGRVLRAHRGHAARKAGTTPVSNARPHAGLPGTTLKEPRKGSRGVYTRSHQRRADEQYGPGDMTAREVQRQVDEHHDLAMRHVQRARDTAARRAKAKGLSKEDTAARVQAAGEGAQRGMDSVFARRFGANQRPSVGRHEIEQTKVARNAAYEAKKQAWHAKEHAKAEVAARKAERGTPSAHQAHLEDQRAAALAELAHHEREHLSTQVAHERARGNARVSTARRKTSPTLISLRAQFKKAKKKRADASTLAGLRGKIADENRRIAGVAPKQADAFMDAIDSLDASAATKRATRQALRDLNERIGLERGATRVNQRAAVNAAEADRQAAMAELAARRGEHATAKAHDIATKKLAVTAPLTGAAKQGRIFEHRYDANKLAERLNEAGHTVSLSNAKGRSPVRFGYTDEGVRLQRSGDASVPVEYTVTEAPGGRWAVVPHLAAERKRLHDVVGTSKATNAMLMRDTRRGLTRAVLPFSLRWLGGQAGEAGLRALTEGAGPLDWLRARRTIAHMNEIDPGSGDEFLMRLPGTHFDVTGEARHTVGAPSLAERYKGRWPEQKMAAITAAGQTLPGHLAKQGFEKWNEFLLGKINNAIERGAITAMTGHAIKRDLMNDRFLGLTQGAIDDAARGLTDTPTQIATARAAADAYGKYSNFSPEMRTTIAHWTPFLPWYINTLRFLNNTIRDHPVKSSLAVALNSASEEWRKEHGLSVYSDEGTQVPDWQLGSYPIFGDKLSRISQFTPFGAFNDPAGALGGLGLPQLAGAFMATRGDDWTGKPLRDSATGLPFSAKQRTIKAIASLGESLIPLSSQALRWSGVGPRYIDRKDPESIPPWRTRFARELPLWPLGDFDSGGSGGGGGGGYDAPPVDVPTIDIPPVDVPPVDVGG
jgi:hypothetical protein